MGLNHLGWLRALRLDGRDLMAELLADGQALTSFEEGKLFGAPWLRALGSLPNEYLHYYYFRRETLRSVHEAAQTRGEFLDEQQSGFFATAGGGHHARPGVRAVGADAAAARGDVHGRQPGGQRRLAAGHLRPGGRRLRPGGPRPDACRDGGTRAPASSSTSSMATPSPRWTPTRSSRRSARSIPRAPAPSRAPPCGRTSWG
ncbi:hypothetical protein GCM10020000_55580 [Streptomyces olivoverticillatus]